MNTKTHTDIKSDHWINRLIERLPKGLRPYVYLMRLDRPVGVWLLLLPSWWGIVLAAGGLGGMDAQRWGVFALFGLGAVIMRGAGCVMNDVWDRELDAKVTRTRTRPLAAGDLSVAQALRFLLMLLLAGLFILLQFNMLTIALGFLVLPLIALYPLMKRITFWPQAFLGVVFNFGVLMGWSAVSGEITLLTLGLYVSGILWTLGYDTVYAHQDKEDDALAGIKSTALKFGDKAHKWVSLFYVLSFAALATVYDDLTTKEYLNLCLIPAGLHFFWQLKTWNVKSPQSSLNIFKSNTLYGALVLIAIFCVSLVQ